MLIFRPRTVKLNWPGVEGAWWQAQRHRHSAGECKRLPPGTKLTLAASVTGGKGTDQAHHLVEEENVRETTGWNGGNQKRKTDLSLPPYLWKEGQTVRHFPDKAGFCRSRLGQESRREAGHCNERDPGGLAIKGQPQVAKLPKVWLAWKLHPWPSQSRAPGDPETLAFLAPPRGQ